MSQEARKKIRNSNIEIRNKSVRHPTDSKSKYSAAGGFKTVFTSTQYGPENICAYYKPLTYGVKPVVVFIAVLDFEFWSFGFVSSRSLGIGLRASNF